MTLRNSLYSIISVDRRQEEDRRMAEPVSNPCVREHLRQINICLRFVFTMTFAGAIFSLVRGFSLGGADEISLGAFMAFGFGLITVFLYRYSSAIQDYLYSETTGNLDKAMERQSVFWMVSTFMAVIWTIVYFVFNS
jgi:hypothetical protein